MARDLMAQSRRSRLKGIAGNVATSTGRASAEEELDGLIETFAVDCGVDNSSWEVIARRSARINRLAQALKAADELKEETE
jgi:hypothetical protein